MSNRERNSVSAMLRTSRIAAVAFLALMLLTMVLFGSYVIRAVLEPLKRISKAISRRNKRRLAQSAGVRAELDSDGDEEMEEQ